MKNKRFVRTVILFGGVVLLAVGLFAIFGRHTKLAESVRQQTAVILKKEYIPNQNVDLESTMAFQNSSSVNSGQRHGVK